MKVSELAELLKEADQDAEVFLSSDHEGNSYRPAYVSFPETMCLQDKDWVSVHPEDLEAGEYEGWEDDMVPAVIVW